MKKPMPVPSPPCPPPSAADTDSELPRQDIFSSNRKNIEEELLDVARQKIFKAPAALPRAPKSMNDGRPVIIAPEGPSMQPIENTQTGDTKDDVSDDCSTIIDESSSEADDDDSFLYGPLVYKSKSFFARAWTIRVAKSTNFLEQFNDDKWSPLFSLKNLVSCSRYKCELTLVQRQDPDYSIMSSHERLVLFCKKESDAEQWRSILLFKRPLVRNILTNVHAKQDNARFATGDILLFHVNTVGAAATRAITLCEWDHTAIVIPIHCGLSFVYGDTQNERWGLLEATPEGVITTPLAARLRQYGEDSKARISVRHLVKRRPQPVESVVDKTPLLSRRIQYRGPAVDNLSDFMVCCVGSPYSFKKMVSGISDPKPPGGYAFNRSVESMQSFHGYFCSELCMIALSSLGVLQNEKLASPTSYWPKSFTMGHDIDLQLCEDFFFTPECDVHVRGP